MRARLQSHRPWATGLLLASIVWLTGCGGAPWGLIVRSAQSELSEAAQVHDRLLQGELRRALIAGEPSATLSVSPYVFMEKGFVVGRVSSIEEQQKITDIAQGVEGLRSLRLYLPMAPPDKGAEKSAEKESDAEAEPDAKTDPGTTESLALHAELRAFLIGDRDVVASRVKFKIIGDTVVLLGVLNPSEQERVLAAVRDVNSGARIENLMLEPERSYTRRRLLRFR